jgi:hypothetical protein
MANDTRIAVDVAKAVFEVAVSDRPGHVIRRERPRRDQSLAPLASCRRPRSSRRPVGRPTTGGARFKHSATR